MYKWHIPFLQYMLLEEWPVNNPITRVGKQGLDPLGKQGLDQAKVKGESFGKTLEKFLLKQTRAGCIDELNYLKKTLG